MRRSLAFLSLIVSVGTSCAQTRLSLPPAEATGIVTGHVFCSDTNQPARLAKVSLLAMQHGAAPADNKASITPAANTSDGVTSVETNLDGSFTLFKVKPGSYYVVVEKPGYVSPRAMFTEKEIADPAPAMRAIVEKALSRVDVQNNQSARAEIRLERGAAVSGTILYDDGSPASDLSVKLLHKDASGKWVRMDRSGSLRFGAGGGTDDRGNFRFASLLPDEYLVQADLMLSNDKMTSMGGGPGGNTMVFNMMTILSSLPFYGEGSPHLSEAKGFKLLGGQELTGQDMTIPISKLYRLSGRVLGGANAHAVNAAKVALISREDDKQLTTTDISREDGLFHFDFVPTGDYTLRVTNARDVTWEAQKPAPGAAFSPFPAQQKERVLERFGGVDMPLLLRGDMLNVLATVPPDAAKDAKQADTKDDPDEE